MVFNLFLNALHSTHADISLPYSSHYKLTNLMANEATSKIECIGESHKILYETNNFSSIFQHITFTYSHFITSFISVLAA